jgi:hypothetical protein
MREIFGYIRWRQAAAFAGFRAGLFLGARILPADAREAETARNIADQDGEPTFYSTFLCSKSFFFKKNSKLA